MRGLETKVICRVLRVDIRSTVRYDEGQRDVDRDLRRSNAEIFAAFLSHGKTGARNANIAIRTTIVTINPQSPPQSSRLDRLEAIRCCSQEMCAYRRRSLSRTRAPVFSS
jgi:hypothetical protein